MMASMPYDTDPLWTVIKEGGPFHAKGRLRAYAERLEQTGRGHAVEELKTPPSPGMDVGRRMNACVETAAMTQS